MNIYELLQATVKNNASDLHLLVQLPPYIRKDGTLIPLTSYSPIKPEEMEQLIFPILTPEQKELFNANKELDFSFGYGQSSSGESGRFRVNLYYQKGYISGAFRFLPPIIRTIEDLRLPKICHNFASLKQGLVLVAGPTGHGKSTTLAALINEINLNTSTHILTIEDPIEYVYPSGKSIISQREMGTDTHSWVLALKAALREDPDVVLVGEMRDPETMAAAITIAETGHLVFSTLHTNSASQSVDRIIDSFPAAQQPQIRSQLASSLKGIISQRLVPLISGGRAPVCEIMLGNPAVASNIRDGKTHLLDSVIQTSKESGMVTLESSLAQLVVSGGISLDTGKSYALHSDELIRLIG